MPYCSEAQAPTRCRVVNRDFVFETTEPSEIDCPQGSPEGGGGGRHQKEQLMMFMLTNRRGQPLFRLTSRNPRRTPPDPPPASPAELTERRRVTRIAAILGSAVSSPVRAYWRMAVLEGWLSACVFFLPRHCPFRGGSSIDRDGAFDASPRRYARLATPQSDG